MDLDACLLQLDNMVEKQSVSMLKTGDYMTTALVLGQEFQFIDTLGVAHGSPV